MKSNIRNSHHRGLQLSALSIAMWLITLQTPAIAGDICQMVENSGGTNGNTVVSDIATTACGQANSADVGAQAFGRGNDASGDYSNAFGIDNTASGRSSNAFGTNSRANGLQSNAFGSHSVAQGNYSFAAGASTEDLFFAVPDLDLDRDGTNESHSQATIAWGNRSVAVGSASRALGQESVVVGIANAVHNTQGSAIGVGNSALGQRDTALGTGNSTGRADPFAFSGNNAAVGIDNIATGGSYVNFGGGPASTSAALGVRNQATGTNSSALGVDNVASAWNSTAIGKSSVASADHSTAIGSHSVADRENTLSVGSIGAERQIVNVADASEDTDAVNLSQLYPLATALGGGASYAGGIFTAPTYIIQASNYTNIGSAFAAVDNALTDINQRIVNAGGVQGERGLSAYEVAVSNGFAGNESDWLQSLGGAQGPTGPIGPEGPAGGGPRSVTYDSDTRDVLTMAGADGTRIANVADAVEATDAVNLGQMEAGDADTLAAANDYTDNTATETLSAANTYTDQRFAEITGLADSFDTFRGEVDRRFTQQDRRIDKQGSMSSAMLNMAINAAGSQSPRGRIAAGVGFQGGERALSVGYAKRIGQRASFSLGGAFSGSEKSAGVGFGLDL